MATKSLVILFAVLVVAAVVLGIGAGTGMMASGMGPGMMWGYGNATGVTPGGWGWGPMMALGWLAMLAFWAAVIVGIVLLVRWLAGSAPATSAEREAEQPLAILRRRYAAGEIDEATYERMRRDLAA